MSPPCHSTNSYSRIMAVSFISLLLEDRRSSRGWKDKLLGNLLAISVYNRFVLDTGVARWANAVGRRLRVPETFIEDALIGLTFFGVHRLVSNNAYSAGIMATVLTVLFVYHVLFDKWLKRRLTPERYATANEIIELTLKMTVSATNYLDVLASFVGVMVYHVMLKI